MRKKFHSAIAVLMAAMLELSCLSVPAGILVSADTAAPSVSNGVYQVKTVQDLQWAVQHPDQTYVLENDLDLSGETGWTPIGTESAPFSGSFNGGGHTITLNIQVPNQTGDYGLEGLFGNVSGQVLNLQVTGKITTGSFSGYLGSVAACLSGGTLSNCVSSVQITAAGRNTNALLVGGIAGAVRNSSNAGTIQDCANQGSLTVQAVKPSSTSGELNVGTSGAVGGILGFVCDKTKAVIHRSINTGTITVTGSMDNIGGICGQSSSNDNSTAVNIVECANKGAITGYQITGERASGIIGYVKSGVIDDCYNLANIIEYTDQGQTVARQGYGNYYGIFGYANLGSSNRLEVRYCYNASPSPLEAEICVVRNAQYGTFQNFYKAGRDEYELQLNAANVSAGTSGTTFTDANDLYQKITSDAEGAAAYVKNPDGGYPILAFEAAKTLGSDAYDGVIRAQSLGGYLYNLYFVCQVGSGIPTDDVTVRATLSSGSTVVDSQELPACSRATVMDTTYAPAAGGTLYAATLNDQPSKLWDTATLTVEKGGQIVYTKTLDSETVVNQSGVAIPFEGMPNYPDGAVSSVYNCGPGLASDEASTTPQDSQMVVVSSTTGDSFTGYIDYLLSHGFTELSKNQIDGNLYESLKEGSQLYYLYYTAASKQTRIVQDNSSTCTLPSLDTDPLGTGKTEFYLYNIDYTHGEGQTNTKDYWQIDCGMSLIIKLPDNSLILVDGGHQRQSSNAALDGYMNFLYQITGQKAGSKIRIRTWFFTHAHGDHVYFAHAFLDKYHDNLDLRSMMYNIPSYQTLGGGYDTGTFLMKASTLQYFPDCQFVKLQTGEQFSLQNVQFQVLYTHEDAVRSDGTSQISDFNDTSTVLKMTMDGKTMMLLGDASGVTQSTLLNLYSDATLKSDAVQVAHHGYNDLQNLYQKIAAPLALFPNSPENTRDSSSAVYSHVMSAAPNTVALFADPDTYRITVDQGGFQYQALPSYRSALYLDMPQLAASTENGGAGAKADLSAVRAKALLSGDLIDKSVHGTSSYSNAETTYMMFDGDTATKYCTSTLPATLVWSMSKPVTVNDYVLTTGDDNAQYKGRDPGSWVLYGSNDTQNWSVLDTVTSSDLPNQNFYSQAYQVAHPASYQYYALKINSNQGANMMQLSELQLYTDMTSEIQAVIDAIASLPAAEDLTLNDQSTVEAAASAYAGLTADQQALVSNADKLQALENRLAELKKQAADQAAAQQVIDMIASLPAAEDLTLNDQPAVEAAASAYAGLTADQQALVSNADKLQTLENRLAELKKQAADQAAAQQVIDMIASLPAAEDLTLNDQSTVEAAASAYAGLTADQQALVSNADKLQTLENRLAELKKQAADQAAAQQVIDMIASLPTAEDLTLNDQSAVEAAASAYAGLTDNQQALVSNADKLQTLENRLAELKKQAVDQAAAQQVIDMIASLPAAEDLTLNDQPAVEAAVSAYAGLTDSQQALVSNADKLQADLEQLQTLKDAASSSSNPSSDSSGSSNPAGTTNSASGKETNKASSTQKAESASDSASPRTGGNSAWVILTLLAMSAAGALAARHRG